MSLETWKKLYYPTPARTAISSDLEAAKHSLRKWEGTTPKVLAEHQLTLHGSLMRGCNSSQFYFEGDTC